MNNFASKCFLKCLQFKIYVFYILIIKMKKKQVKYRLTQQKWGSNLTQTLKLHFDDDYILKALLPQKLPLPHSITNKYEVQCSQKWINFTIKNNKFYDATDNQQICQCFKGLCVYHVRAKEFNSKQEQLIQQAKWYKGNQVIGIKKFHIEQGRFQQGDYIIYSMAHVKNFINSLKSYIKNQSLLYQLDTLLLQKQIPQKYCEIVTKILTDTYKKQIIKIAESLQLKISKIQDRSEQKIQRERIYRDTDRKPFNSIGLLLSGNGIFVHDLFLGIEAIFSKVQLTCVEIQEDSIPDSDGISDANNIFEQYANKIFKIAPFAVVLLKTVTDPYQLSQLKRRLKMKTFEIGDQDQLTVQQINILQSEHKSKNLKHHMSLRKIFWEKIEFGIGAIYITCDRMTKINFVNECKNLLKSFVKVKNQCVHFDNKFIVEVFKKYFKNGLERKFYVGFDIGDNYIIRTNYNKYEQEIQEQLKTIRQKIKKKIIKFVSLKSIKHLQQQSLSTPLTPNFYPQRINPKGYEHNLLGHCLYQMNNISIRMRKLQSLKHQQQCLIYLQDDRICEESLFYSIIQKNNVNLQSFLADAHRTKKPERLRQYITEECEYAYRTILLHGGPQKVTNTLRRDVETLFGNLESRICAVLLRHQGDFLQDVFYFILKFIKSQSINYYNSNNNSNLSNSSNSKPNNLEVDFYYEGGTDHLCAIEKIMKSRELGIVKLSAFCLDEFDIQKIYALQYCSMRVLLQTGYTQVSPLIAELTNRELSQSSQKPKKIAFSVPQYPNSQLIEFFISTKTNMNYKITHTESSILSRQNKKFSTYPRIEKMEELESELQQIVTTITKYLNLDFIVISGNSVTDGLHGRVVKYCKQINMIKCENGGAKRELIPVTLLLDKKEMYEALDREVTTYEIKVNKLKDWYEITSYKEQFDQISHLIAF